MHQATSRINRATLNSLAEIQQPGRSNLVFDLIEMFFSTTPQKISNMEKLLESSDLDGACKLSHSLKSSAYSLGADTLGELCDQFENLKNKSTIAEAQTLLTKIQNEFTEIQDELREIQIATGKAQT